MNRSLQVAAHVLAAILACSVLSGTARANWSAPVQLNSDRTYPQVRTATDMVGGMFVAWRDSLGLNSPLYVSHVDQYGGGSFVKINDGGYPNFFVGQYMQMDICSDNAGGAFVAYEDYYNNGLGTHGTRTWLTRLDPFLKTYSGFPVQLNSGTTAERPAVCSDGSGNAIVSWADQRFWPGFGCDSSTPWQLFAQKVDAAGNKWWGSGGAPVSDVGDLATDLNNEPAMRPAPVSSGGAYFTWTGFDLSCGKTLIKMQRLDGGGARLCGTKGAVVFTGSAGSTPVANCLGNGNDCIVTTFDPSSGVHVQRFNEGGPVWGSLTLDGNLTTGATASDGLGGVFVAWFSSHANGLLVQDVDSTRTLKLPSYDLSALGTYCADNSFSGQPSFPPAVVCDGKQGALVLSSGTGPFPNIRQARAVGVSATGRPAFQSAGVAVSPGGMNATALSGVPGYINNGLFAWANDQGAWAQQVTLSDLDATTTPPGWAGPLVPRSIPNSTNTLVGAMTMVENQPVYLNWVVTQRGPNPTPAFQSRVYLDGGYFWGQNVPDGAAPGYYSTLNVGPLPPIPGGPHTLTLYTDWQGTPDFSIDEASELDDVYSQQWTWEPTWWNPSPKLDGPIGVLGPQKIPNGTGHKFAAGTGASNVWVVSTAARRGPTFDHATGGLVGYGDSYGLQLYDLPLGAEEFTHRIGESHQSYNGTNFILTTIPTAPETLYTLAVRDSVQDANPDSCWSDLQLAGTRVGPAAASSWLGQTMASGELADVYLLNATPRQIVRLALREREGVGDPGPLHDLAFEVFPPATSGLRTRGGGMASHPSAEAIDTLTFVATLNGAYEVVVYRQQGDRAGTPLVYDLQTSSTQTLDAPESPHALSFAGATRNPVSGPAELAFALPTPGEASLSIYDVNGRRVRELLRGEQAAGEHRIRWDATAEDGSRARPGLYFARLTFSGTTLMRRLTLLD